MPDDTPLVQIITQKVPVGSSIGAAVLIAILLLGMFIDLPGVRGTVIWGAGFGLLFAVALILWRKRTTGRR
jgi:hypothetical protein